MNGRSYFDVLRGRGRQPPKRPVRKRPKMPSGPWRFFAVVCFAVGAALAWAVSRDAERATIVVRMVAGGLAALAIGMYVIEGWWARRFHHPPDQPKSPIGKRR